MVCKLYNAALISAVLYSVSADGKIYFNLV